MNIIKLSAIDSTNSYLKRLVKEGVASDGLIITTDNQTLGRGQQGASWQFQEGKSLAFSVLKRYENLLIHDQFSIAMATSIGVQKALKKIGISEVKIKWPNDILSDQKKLCGILVENMVQGTLIKETIVGIGLNVNETNFLNVPKATSLKLESGINHSINDVLNEIARAVLDELEALKLGDHILLKNEYELNLFRMGVPSRFKDVSGKEFEGTILGVTELGQLRVAIEGDNERKFSFKEITLFY